jgi:hypothetical protein
MQAGAADAIHNTTSAEHCSSMASMMCRHGCMQHDIIVRGLEMDDASYHYLKTFTLTELPHSLSPNLIDIRKVARTQNAALHAVC